MVKKVTFTLDDITIRRLEDASERLRKAKSEVVREAIADYHERTGRLSEVERRRMLSVLDRLATSPPTRPSAEVDREIDAIRAARKSGGRAGGRGRR